MPHPCQNRWIRPINAGRDAVTNGEQQRVRHGVQRDRARLVGVVDAVLDPQLEEGRPSALRMGTPGGGLTRRPPIDMTGGPV